MATNDGRLQQKIHTHTHTHTQTPIYIYIYIYIYSVFWLQVIVQAGFVIDYRIFFFL